MSFLFSGDLDAIASGKDNDGLAEMADGMCTSGYDNDGSTGFEIFENGFELGVRAGSSPVVAVDCDSTTYFFIGTVEEVTQKIEALPDNVIGDDEGGDYNVMIRFTVPTRESKEATEFNFTTTLQYFCDQGFLAGEFEILETSPRDIAGNKTDIDVVLRRNLDEDLEASSQLAAGYKAATDNVGREAALIAQIERELSDCVDPLTTEFAVDKTEGVTFS